MASGSSGKELSASLLSCSEPVYDFICDLCSEEDKNIEAEGYCNDCNDYLCGDCFKHHRKGRFTKAHVLVGKLHMPHEKPSIRKDQNDGNIFTEKCKKHREEYIKYYCKTHGELGCTVCITINHRDCKPVEYIKDISCGAAESQEYQDLITQVETLTTVTQDVIQEARAGITTAETSNTTRILAIREFKEELVTLIGKLESEAVKQSEDRTLKDVGNLKVVVNSCSDTMRSTQIIKEELQSLNAAHQNCRLFVAMKEANVKLEKLRHDCDTTVEKNKRTQHTFPPNKNLVKLLRADDALGTFSTEQTELAEFPVKWNVTNNPYELQASHVCDINVRSATNTRDCYITGSVVIAGGKLVVTDWLNCMAKLFDVTSCQLMASLSIQENTGPWDITRVNDVVAVTIPDLKQIHLIEVTNTMKVDRKIDVHGNCRGIDYNNGTFVVSYQDEKLETLDLQGQVLRTIHLNKPGSFKQTYFVKFDRRNKSVYVSDYLTHKVTRLSLEGDVMSGYSGSMPYNMCLDTQGNIYICDIYSNEIVMLNPDCSKIKVLLSQSDGLCKAMSVALCAQTNRLYVGGEDNSVKMYQLS